MRTNLYIAVLALLLAGFGHAAAQTPQTSIGIGTTTPDSHSVLDIVSTTKGVLLPRLTTAQQTTLAGILGPAQMGMIITDASTGTPLSWSGSAWTAVDGSNPVTATAPLSVATNNIKINAGTNIGDLLTWDGTNWVNTQPAVQHFSFPIDNHQPYLVTNYVIGWTGIYPSQSNATNPFVGEIYMMGCNFAPVGFFMCDGQLLSISQFDVLFNLIGATYGGNGTTTFGLPDLRGRVPIHMGPNGTSTYTIGQIGGAETKTFSH
jgi:microcystin-dependent protein